MTTLDGSNVTLVCDATGVPTPQITWYSIDGTVVQRGGSFLTLVSVTPEDSGTYTCSAEALDSTVNVSSEVSIRGTILDFFIHPREGRFTVHDKPLTFPSHPTDCFN